MFIIGDSGMYVYSDRMQTVYHWPELYRGAFPTVFQPDDFPRRALALAEGADISVDMVVNILPKGIRRVVDTLVNLLIAVFACLCLRSLVTFIGSNQGVTAVP